MNPGLESVDDRLCCDEGHLVFSEGEFSDDLRSLARSLCFADGLRPSAYQTGKLVRSIREQIRGRAAEIRDRYDREVLDIFTEGPDTRILQGRWRPALMKGHVLGALRETND